MSRTYRKRWMPHYAMTNAWTVHVISKSRDTSDGSTLDAWRSIKMTIVATQEKKMTPNQKSAYLSSEVHSTSSVKTKSSPDSTVEFRPLLKHTHAHAHTCKLRTRSTKVVAHDCSRCRLSLALQHVACYRPSRGRLSTCDPRHASRGNEKPEAYNWCQAATKEACHAVTAVLSSRLLVCSFVCPPTTSRCRRLA